MQDIAESFLGLPAATAREFGADTVESVKRQDEARKAWSDGKRLVAGAYYRHRNGAWLRRVIELKGGDVYWTDNFGPGLCLCRVFLRNVSGPL
jgi:hypothetical protein